MSRFSGRLLAATGSRDLLLLFATAGILLLTRPHFGLLYHDGLFYVLLALHHQDPGPLANDLFLQFSAQRDFTLFPRIYGVLIEWLAFERAALTVHILGLGIWFGALVSIARCWHPGPRSWWAVALVISLPMYYSLLSLEFAEPIVSARLPAEALSLAAVAAALRNYRFAAFGFLAMAVMLHPLTAAAALGVLYFWLAMAKPAAWLLVPAAAGASVLLGAAGVAPFSELFNVADEQWRTVLEFRNAYLFPSRWGQDAVSIALLPVLVLSAAAAVVQTASFRRVALATVITLVLGLGSSLVLGDWLGNVFVLQVQPWRVQWLGLVLALLATPILVTRLWSHSECGRTAALLTIAAWASNQTVGAIGLGATALVLAVFRRRLGPHVPRAATWLAGAGACASWALWIGGWLMLEWRLSAEFYQSNTPSTIVFLKTPGVLLAAFAVTALLIRTRRGLIPGAAVAIAVLTTGAMFWDRSPTSEQRLVAAVEPLPDEIADLPNDSQILWPQRPDQTWLRLRRSSYVSYAQGAGVVFNRRAALEWRSRMQRTAPFRLGTLSPSEDGWQKVTAGTPIRPEHLALTCRMNPELDLVVSNHDWPEFDSMPFSPYDSEVFFNAYRCAQFRNNRDRPLAPRQPANLP